MSRWWKWAVVTTGHITVHPAGALFAAEFGGPVPEGEPERRQTVDVLRRYRREQAAVNGARQCRTLLWDAGRIADAQGVEVWSREAVESAGLTRPWNPPVRAVSVPGEQQAAPSSFREQQ